MVSAEAIAVYVGGGPEEHAHGGTRTRHHGQFAAIRADRKQAAPCTSRERWSFDMERGELDLPYRSTTNRITASVVPSKVVRRVYTPALRLRVESSTG